MKREDDDKGSKECMRVCVSVCESMSVCIKDDGLTLLMRLRAMA